uniref:Putative large gyy 1 n=1 Tax=Amblyomma tuberculatum TaxID=48802 RepID=A0A6M2E7D3_9ACAR
MKFFATLAFMGFMACTAFADEVVVIKDAKEAKEGAEEPGVPLPGYDVVVVPNLVNPGLVGYPALVGPGPGYGIDFQTGYDAFNRAHKSGFQKGAAGHNQGSSDFARGTLHRTFNAYKNSQGYSHSSGFSATDSKIYGAGRRQESSGHKGGEAGHQSGFGQSSFGKAAGVGPAPVALKG